MSKKKILVFAPHPDDEVLGLGGYLLSESEKGSEIEIVFATSDDSSIRDVETKAVMEELGSGYSILYPGMDGKLSQVDMAELIGKLDDIVYRMEPDELFVNYPSHHQDHKVLYDATMACCRMKQWFIPPIIVLYEYPFVFNNSEQPCGGKMYYPMSESELKDKIQLFELYVSQNKEFPSPLNETGIKTLARTRGMECGRAYAECFYIQKMVL